MLWFVIIVLIKKNMIRKWKNLKNKNKKIWISPKKLIEDFKKKSMKNKENLKKRKSFIKKHLINKDKIWKKKENKIKKNNKKKMTNS